LVLRLLILPNIKPKSKLEREGKISLSFIFYV